jgi:hypothetical protein
MTQIARHTTSTGRAEHRRRRMDDWSWIKSPAPPSFSRIEESASAGDEYMQTESSTVCRVLDVPQRRARALSGKVDAGLFFDPEMARGRFIAKGLASDSKNVRVYVLKETGATIQSGFAPPDWVRWYPHFEKDFNEVALQVLIPTPRQPKADRFEPSSTLIAYVKKAVEQAGVHDDVESAAKEMVRNAVVRLFNTMATSVRDSGKPAPYPVAEDGRFANPVAKALLFRVPVGVYEAPAFLAQLEREVVSAAKQGLVRGPFWRLDASPTGSLVLEVQQPRPHDTPEDTTRAEVVRIA